MSSNFFAPNARVVLSKSMVLRPSRSLICMVGTAEIISATFANHVAISSITRS